jgi:hypothetical protein
VSAKRRPARATRKWRRNALELLKMDSEWRPAGDSPSPGGQKGSGRGRLGRRVRQAGQHGDQRPIVEDGEPFA